VIARCRTRPEDLLPSVPIVPVTELRGAVLERNHKRIKLKIDELIMNMDAPFNILFIFTLKYCLQEAEMSAKFNIWRMVALYLIALV